MWKETPRPVELRKEFPDIALHLESSFVKIGLETLGIKYSVTTQAKQKHFQIELNDNFTLRISPVDKGMQGYGEFLSWYMPSNHAAEGTIMPSPSIRAFVQLIENTKDRKVIVYSFTDHQENIEDLIRSSLNYIFHATGRKFRPVMRRK